jgi:hypothetical protein
MNKTYYQQKILHMLQDTEYYKSIGENIERKKHRKNKTSRQWSIIGKYYEQREGLSY